ncbi:hypothetical protein CTEN210_13069 [Chaetoceros tenuissimus]|uniref:Uncharacterized protein n=1 Tax=Chaetoceros tenuissimus TaxID=426638 RepID=A0AAD3D2Q8_9STRA|nr:hypothetical protein CTEN210_13069 [Chaetoceros tenuissimus]
MTLQFYIDHLPTNFRETNYVQISSFSSTSCFGGFSVWSSRCPGICKRFFQESSSNCTFRTHSIQYSSSNLPGGKAHAEARLVGEIKTSGIVFKDTLNIEQFDDPKVKGVTLYISNFQKPINERLNPKDFFTDPSYASVTCARTGPVAIADNITKGKQGEEVFEENKSLLFKQLRVQRIYDEENNTVVYASFNTRLDKNSDDNKSRFKSSVCAVNLN